MAIAAKQKPSRGHRARKTGNTPFPTPAPSPRSERPPELDRDLGDLFGALVDAARLRPPALLSSILGPPWTWLPPHDRYSEFGLLDLWRPGRTLRFLLNTSVPSLPTGPPPFGPPLLDNLFWHPTLILQRPDQNGSYTSFGDEHWFFINGILTDDNVAQRNAAYLSYLFHRPITLIQNSTDAVLIDLLQCALGRTWHHPTEPLRVAFPAIHDALLDDRKRRVVVVCHSQGTIIMANVLRWLEETVRRNEASAHSASRAVPRAAAALAAEPAGPEIIVPDADPLDLGEFDRLRSEHLEKLEIYAFATCAQRMRHLDPGPLAPAAGSSPRPWIEHFGNQNDLVARLGMLAPRPERWGIRIDGPRYERRGAWGHLLNAHYLTPIRGHQKHGHRRGGDGGPDPYALVNADLYPRATPRLFEYLNGGSPEA